MNAAEHELTSRLLWLCQLRWLAAASIIVLTLAAVYVLGIALPVSLLVLIGAIVAVYNVVLYTWTRSNTERSGVIPVRLGTWFAHLQIDLDFIALALVIHLTGGVESPLGAYLVFHMIIASTLLAPRAALAQATVASVLYAALVTLEARGLVSHYALGFMRPDFYTSAHVYLVVVVLMSVLYGAIYLAASIVQRLHEHEQELSDLTIRLQQEMQRTQQAYEQIQATQNMQVRYMRRVSHELRRPLAAASSLLTVILGGFSDAKPEAKTTQLPQRAVVRLQHGLDLVADLLLLSLTREAPLKEERSWLDLTQLVKQSADELADRAQQAGVTVNLDLDGRLEPIWAQASGLSTVLSNLIGNALKYTDTGGQVTVSADQDGQHTFITIADTGMGISAEDLPHIFEEFFRTQQVRNRNSAEGTGLGLSIVQSVVEAHDGHCEVESEPRQGTKFTIILPRGHTGMGDREEQYDKNPPEGAK